MMQKLTILLILLAMTITACSSGAPSQNGSANGQTLNAMSQLAVGTLKLDGTDNAITKEQAAQLLPLWQVYKQLIGSDTAAQTEIDGLSSQIRDSMTADQRKAITDMKLSQSDVFTYMQQGGGAASGASGQSDRSSTSQGPGGGFPGGDPVGMPPPDMGGGMPGGGMSGGSTTRQASGTQTANSGQSGAQSARPGNMNRVPSALIDALIQYLQKVAAS